jgi:hypothetical protein
MPGELKIRGKVNVVLNGLVREGVIAGFRTTFGAEGEFGAPVVTITVSDGQSPGEVKARVMDALADIAIGIDI